MKTVFSNHEIAHVWVHQGQSSGRASSCSFQDGAFYSYGTVIARIIKHKGKRVFVLDRASFSNSTSKHQGNVRSAIPERESIISVNIGYRGQYLDFTPKSLVQHFLEQAKPQQVESKLKHKHAEEILRQRRYIKKAIECAEVFGLSTKSLEKKLRNHIGKHPDAESIYKAYREKVEASVAARRATIAERERQRREILKAAAIKRAEGLISGEIVPTGLGDFYFGSGLHADGKWSEDSNPYLEERSKDLGPKINAMRDEFRIREAERIKAETKARAEAIIKSGVIDENPYAEYFGYGDHYLDEWPEIKQSISLLRDKAEKLTDQERINLWLSGRGTVLRGELPTLLRVEGDIMVTSKGARVPLREAELAFKFVMRKRKSGWHRNGEEFKIGMYHLDAVNEFGVVAGCHKIKWDEIERFGKLQNWINNESQEAAK